MMVSEAENRWRNLFFCYEKEKILRGGRPAYPSEQGCRALFKRRVS